MLDCGPDRWGRLLIQRAVRKKVLAQRPYRDIDYVLALDDCTRLGALRFRQHEKEPFLAPTLGKLPPLVRLQTLLLAVDAIHSDSETAADLIFLLGAGSPLGGARPKAAVALPDGRLALAKQMRPQPSGLDLPTVGDALRCDPTAFNVLRRSLFLVFHRVFQ
jgi:serine/threonine-protein kinase HipA